MVPARTLIIGVLLSLLPQVALAQEVDGAILFRDRCATCHGAELQGQPDWMTRRPDGRMPAPPHDETGHTWHHSDRQLFRIIKEGLQSIAPGYETDMPAFKDSMADHEIRAVINYIKGTWPDREQEFQRQRSEADSE